MRPSQPPPAAALPAASASAACAASRTACAATRVAVASFAAQHACGQPQRARKQLPTNQLLVRPERWQRPELWHALDPLADEDPASSVETDPHGTRPKEPDLGCLHGLRTVWTLDTWSCTGRAARPRDRNTGPGCSPRSSGPPAPWDDTCTWLARNRAWCTSDVVWAVYGHLDLLLDGTTTGRS